MMTLETLSDAVNQGKAYYLDLIQEFRVKMKAGCQDCDEPVCLGNLISALEYDLDSSNLTDLTIMLYGELQDVLGSYTGSYVINPNIVLPGTIIIVENSGITISGVSDENGNYLVTEDIGLYPNFTIYDANGESSPAQYNSNTKLITGLNAEENFTITFS